MCFYWGWERFTTELWPAKITKKMNWKMGYYPDLLLCVKFLPFRFKHFWGENFQFDSFFSKGLKPTTRQCCKGLFFQRVQITRICDFARKSHWFITSANGLDSMFVSFFLPCKKFCFINMLDNFESQQTCLTILVPLQAEHVFNWAN